MKKYPIMHDGRTIGRAEVEREGMFYLIRCRFSSNDLTGIVSIGQRELGKCVSCVEKYTLIRRIPFRDMPVDPVFVLRSGTEKLYVRLQEGELVDKLEDLCDAIFTSRDGTPFLVFNDQKSISSATGQ